MCKKFLLAAVNARYIHSNPGVYSLRAFAKERLPEAEIQIAEYTINHQMDRILQDIYRKKPDFVGFSCYIWNISQVYELVRDLKQVLPETEIWLGGPEVSYDSGRILSQEPEIRGIMRGEGELTFSQVAEAYLAAEDRLAAEDEGKLLVGKVDIDESPEQEEKHEIETIPTLIVYQGGKASEPLINPGSMTEIEDWLKENGAV